MDMHASGDLQTVPAAAHDPAPEAAPIAPTPPLPFDFPATSTQLTLDFIAATPEAQDRLRDAFECGCLHEELLRLTHFSGPPQNWNVAGIDNKGPFMKVVQGGKALVMNANMGVQMIINRNVAMAGDAIVKSVLGLDISSEPALSVATTPRQKQYEALQIRAVIMNSGEYVMPARAFVHEVVAKQSRIAWSTRTRNCVAAQQGWQCNICDELLTDCYDIDHQVPLFKGGADAFSNLQALCVPCHRNKSAAERSRQPILLP
jgi:5-methylcytosine-specific restriction endonuclease McrA